MLQITSAQMHALENDWERRFAARLVAALDDHLACRFAGQSDARRLAFAQQCIRHGRARGLRHEHELTRYANLAAFLGIDFESHPSADARLRPCADEGWDLGWLLRVGGLVEQWLRERERDREPG